MRFSIFHGARDNTPKPGDLTWGDFIKALIPHQFRPTADKLLCDAFSPAAFVEGSTRSNSNVEALSMFVADLDAISDDEIATFSKTVEDLGWACLMHTTWSHHHKPNSLRAILPLSRPATPDEWPDLWDRINDALGGYCDPACRDAARLYFGAFAPSSEDSRKAAFHHVFEGEPVDIDALADLPGPAPTPRERVTREQVVRFARTLTRKRNDTDQERGHLLQRVIAGEPFAEPGNRDNTIFRLAITVSRSGGKSKTRSGRNAKSPIPKRSLNQ